MNTIQRIFHFRDKPKDSLNGSRYSFFFGEMSSGKPVKETASMQMTAGYSCVRSCPKPLQGYR